jgi:hypothetical protein
MKPSEENSIVPKFIRDKVREMKRREREEDIKRSRDNTPTQRPSSKEDSKALKELIEKGKMPKSSSGLSKEDQIQLYGFDPDTVGTAAENDRMPSGPRSPAKSVSQDVLESMRAQQPPSSRQPAGGTPVLGEERFMTQPPQFRESDNFTQPYAKGGLVKKKMGGMVKKASKGRSHRGDGVCQKGFTKGKMY